MLFCPLGPPLRMAASKVSRGAYGGAAAHAEPNSAPASIRRNHASGFEMQRLQRRLHRGARSGHEDLELLRSKPAPRRPAHLRAVDRRELAGQRPKVSERLAAKSEQRHRRGSGGVRLQSRRRVAKQSTLRGRDLLRADDRGPPEFFAQRRCRRGQVVRFSDLALRPEDALPRAEHLRADALAISTLVAQIAIEPALVQPSEDQVRDHQRQHLRAVP